MLVRMLHVSTIQEAEEKLRWAEMAAREAELAKEQVRGHES